MIRALALLLLLASAVPAVAENTVACHCFKDRSFDPATPAAADPYILATTRSSLLSAALGPAKAVLVRAVMSGTSPDDLWIAYWAAARTRREGAAVLAAREAAGSWRAALRDAGLDGSFGAALERGAPDAELARIATDDVLVSRVHADPAAVRALRAGGARPEEVILAAVLSTKLGTSPLEILMRARANDATWGTVLHDAGLSPGDLDGVVRAALR